MLENPPDSTQNHLLFSDPWRRIWHICHRQRPLHRPCLLDCHVARAPKRHALYGDELSSWPRENGELFQSCSRQHNVPENQLSSSGRAETCSCGAESLPGPWSGQHPQGSSKVCCRPRSSSGGVGPMLPRKEVAPQERKHRAFWQHP